MMRLTSELTKKFHSARYLPRSLVIMRAIAIAGIAIGSATLVISLSIVSGFQREYRRSVLDFNAHVVVLKGGEITDLGEAERYIEGLKKTGDEVRYEEGHKGLLPLASFLRRAVSAASELHDEVSYRIEARPLLVDIWERLDPRLILRFLPETLTELSRIEEKGVTGITPFLYREGLIISKGIIKGVVIKGIEPSTIREVNLMRMELKDGRTVADVLAPDAANPRILLGKALYERLGGPDTIRLMVPEMKKGNQFVTAKVAGTFESGLYDYDSQFALMNMDDTQKIFETGQVKATGVEIKLDDPGKADAIAYRINSDLPASYQAITWGELNRDLFEALSIEKLVFSIIMGILVIVAAFNIIGVLVLLICYRAHEVAILKALGLKRETLQRIFTRGGLSTGLVGTLTGITAGIAVSFALKHFQFIKLAPEVYFLKTLPIDISWAICGIIGLFSVLMCWGTSRIAAKRLASLPINENL